MIEILGRCGNLPWRERIGMPVALLMLLFFVGIGIDAIIHPKRHMNSYHRSGGEMLRESHATGVQLAGLVFSCAAAWMLYEIVGSIWAECFG